MLKLFYDKDPNIIEVGIDEAGRGCLSGRVYVAGVIFAKNLPIINNRFSEIKDSKKLSRKKRADLRKYIEENALAYSVNYSEPNEIDHINILNATLKTMHKVVDSLKIQPNLILVDGNRWNIYTNKEGDVIPHQLIKGGDNRYYSIAAASILAKEYHDEYVRKLCEINEDYIKYDWLNNMCYGTKKHIDAIKKYGICKYHRKTFGICKQFS